MKTVIISYSRTGNNKLLAASLASELRAEHIQLDEAKPKGYFPIALDMLFNRTPKISTIDINVDNVDLLIFVSPVWMGHVASHMRGALAQFKGKLNNYMFVSLNGGGEPNSNLASELTKRVGKEPAEVFDLHITDLLPKDPKPELKEITAYKVTDEDVKKLARKVIDRLNVS